MRKTVLLTPPSPARSRWPAATTEKTAEAPPPPQEMTDAAIGHYCGMNVLEHTGPKGQIILASRKDPVWFSSARDAISFTHAAGGAEGHPRDLRLRHGQGAELGQARRERTGSMRGRPRS